MCLFIETICYAHGRFQRLESHNERFNRTRHHFFGLQSIVELESSLSIPQYLKNETVKCRVIYGPEIVSVDYSLYKIRPVNSLKIVRDDTIDYSYKYADRTKLDVLFNLRGQSDDILIVKNGFITDTSYANIIFERNGKWYSPKNPLLRGTRIDSYFREGLVTPDSIQINDLPLFSEARIVNSMISIEHSPGIPIKSIME
ncbi:MAG TPA: aminotransferase class IV [Prolixibacteraceae bacterium]|jgi:4-amino-4-deoxychorismate lyase